MVIEKKSVDSRFTNNTNISPVKRINSSNKNSSSNVKSLEKSALKKQWSNLDSSKKIPIKKGTQKIPNQSNPQSTLDDPSNVRYNYAGNESWGEFIRKNLPKELFPTNLTGHILGIVFLIVILIAFIQFPLGDLLGGQIEDLKVTVGIPWPFLIFDAFNPLEQPLQMKGFLLDLVIYLIISYAIEILINVFLYSEFIRSKKQKKIKPKMFNIKRRSLSENVANKILSNNFASKKEAILTKKNDGKKFDKVTSIKKRVDKNNSVSGSKKDFY
jgi:hypothetical protein